MKKIFSNFEMLLAFGLASVMFISCNDDGDKTTNSSLSSVNIQGVEALFISSSNTGSKLYGVKSSVLRSSDSEEIFEIKYVNSVGEEIQKSNPSYIFNLKDFIILGFGANYLINSGFDEVYLVKKSDGKVFEIPREYMPHIVGNKYHYDYMYFNTMNKIQEDGSNNMYYTTYQTSSPHKKTLYKVSLSSPSSLQFQEVSAVNDNINGFCVDKSGNILYTYYDYNTHSQKYRYRKSAENFINFATFSYDDDVNRSQRVQLVWTGTDGQMYAVQEIVQNGTQEGLYLVKIQEGNVVSAKNMNTKVEGIPTNVFNVKGKIFYSQTNTLFNLSNEAEYAEISCLTVANLELNNDLYNFNQATFTLTLINAASGGISVVYDLDETKLGNYDIDKIINVAQDGITFSAVDLGNGQYVVAKIFTDNTVAVQTSISGLVTSVMSLN